MEKQRYSSDADSNSRLNAFHWTQKVPNVTKVTQVGPHSQTKRFIQWEGKLQGMDVTSKQLELKSG